MAGEMGTAKAMRLAQLLLSGQAAGLVAEYKAKLQNANVTDDVVAHIGHELVQLAAVATVASQQGLVLEDIRSFFVANPNVSRAVLFSKDNSDAVQGWAAQSPLSAEQLWDGVQLCLLHYEHGGAFLREEAAATRSQAEARGVVQWLFTLSFPGKTCPQKVCEALMASGQPGSRSRRWSYQQLLERWVGARAVFDARVGSGGAKWVTEKDVREAIAKLTSDSSEGGNDGRAKRAKTRWSLDRVLAQLRELTGDSGAGGRWTRVDVVVASKPTMFVDFFDGVGNDNDQVGPTTQWAESLPSRIDQLHFVCPLNSGDSRRLRFEGPPGSIFLIGGTDPHVVEATAISQLGEEIMAMVRVAMEGPNAILETAGWRRYEPDSVQMVIGTMAGASYSRHSDASMFLHASTDDGAEEQCTATVCVTLDKDGKVWKVHSLACPRCTRTSLLCKLTLPAWNTRTHVFSGATMRRGVVNAQSSGQML